MKREIKFRTWDEVKKEMAEYDFLFTNDVENFCKADWNLKDLMQFTGLKDKNGKEIYEGDLLLIPDEYTEVTLDDGTGPIESWPHIAEVVFQDGSFGINITDSADDYKKGFYSPQYTEHWIGDTFSEFEIIGNIYDNPEPPK